MYPKAEYNLEYLASLIGINPSSLDTYLLTNVRTDGIHAADAALHAITYRYYLYLS